MDFVSMKYNPRTYESQRRRESFLCMIAYMLLMLLVSGSCDESRYGHEADPYAGVHGSCTEEIVEDEVNVSASRCIIVSVTSEPGCLSRADNRTHLLCARSGHGTRCLHQGK